MPEEQALRERAAVITSEHTVRGMFLQSAVEFLRRARGQAVVDEMLASAGMTADWRAMRKVPLQEFNKLRMHVCTAFLPVVGSIEEASAKVGASAVEIFFESVAGRTMMLLAGKDPHRLMGAAPNGYGLAVEDGATRKYEKVGENEGRFEFVNDRLGPCHQVGVFSAAIQVVCGVTINVEIEQPALLNFTFKVRW